MTGWENIAIFDAKNLITLTPRPLLLKLFMAILIFLLGNLAGLLLSVNSLQVLYLHVKPQTYQKL
jgi:hypothetical protein